jgi:hypothetical protein
MARQILSRHAVPMAVAALSALGYDWLAISLRDGLGTFLMAVAGTVWNSVARS